ncbi:Membrane protease YdiL, CAAX protease family [Ruminococcaceae bacterium YRB3002]|nr:Membrane protease YdiL, CAAX protease family [Ruminococcaceae bacterium YRB3002]
MSEQTAQANTGTSFESRVLRDMSSAVIVINRKGQVVYVNAPASRMLEIVVNEGDEPLRTNDYRKNEVNYDFWDNVIQPLYDKGHTHNALTSYTTPSGRKFVLRMSSSYLPGDGEDALIVVTLDDETEKEAIKRKLSDSSRTFSLFLVFFCSWIIIYALWKHLNDPVPGSWMTVGVEILSLLMMFFMLKFTSLTLHDLGIKVGRKTLGKTVKTAVLIALGGVALLFVIKFVARLIAPGSFRPDLPFFDITLFGLPQLGYIFTAGIQEFLARSVMQSNLERIIDSKHAGVQAIIVSSLIFAAIHVHLGFFFMIGAAILAGLEGILYYKQRNIYGVWIVHWSFGVCGTLLSLIDH